MKAISDGSQVAGKGVPRWKLDSGYLPSDSVVASGAYKLAHALEDEVEGLLKAASVM